MKDLIKWGLLGYGAYLLWQRSQGGATEAAATEPTRPMIPLRDMVAGRAQGAGEGPMLTFDQWNYYYSAVRGIPGPAIEAALPGRDRSLRMTVDEWYAAVTAIGGVV